MTHALHRSLLVVSLLLAAACTTGGADPDANADRYPLGKADSYGSCSDTDCDGQSPDGNCWCDEACIEFGDCCSDRVEVCEAPVSQFCGGFLGQPCGDDEYCHFEEVDGCGFADAGGTCRLMPELCVEVFAPVCGCDGQTYGNSCFASAAGTSVASEGACDAGSDCQPVLCELFCENGFATGDDGCEVCACAP